MPYILQWLATSASQDLYWMWVQCHSKGSGCRSPGAQGFFLDDPLGRKAHSYAATFSSSEVKLSCEPPSPNWSRWAACLIWYYGLILRASTSARAAHSRRRSCRATAARSLGGDSRGFKHRFQGSFCRLVPGRADSRPRGLESNGGRLPSVSRANGT